MAIRVNTETSDPKTEQLFLYVAEKLQECPAFGATLMNKALYYIDNVSYLKTGKPISTLTYVKQEHGPTPQPKKYLALRDKMVNNGDIELLEVEKFGHIQKRIIPKRQAVISTFTAEEIQLMDEIIGHCSKYNATELSALTHDQISWQLARNLEDLPYNTYLLTRASLDEDDITWAKGKISAHRLVSNN